MNTSTILDEQDLKRNLCQILQTASEGKIGITLSQSSEALAECGVDSMILLSFLVAIEDEMDIEWSPNQPYDTFTSIDSIAAYLMSIN